MYGVKAQFSSTYFREMGSFFSSDFITQHFVDIFSKPQKVSSQINSGIAQFSTKRHKNNRPGISFYKDYWYQRTTQWVNFYGIGDFFFSQIL